MTRELVVRIFAYTVWLVVHVAFSGYLGNFADSVRNKTPYDPSAIILALPIVLVGEIIGIAFLLVIEQTKEPLVQHFGLRASAGLAVAFSLYLAWNIFSETSAILFSQLKVATIWYCLLSLVTNVILIGIAFSARATPR